jgi:hypothetical protein
MQNVREFLKYADACRAMAQRAPSEALRVRLSEMAYQWSRLAEERQRQSKAEANDRRPRMPMPEMRAIWMALD